MKKPRRPPVEPVVLRFVPEARRPITLGEKWDADSTQSFEIHPDTLAENLADDTWQPAPQVVDDKIPPTCWCSRHRPYVYLQAHPVCIRPGDPPTSTTYVYSGSPWRWIDGELVETRFPWYD